MKFIFLLVLFMSMPILGMTEKQFDDLNFEINSSINDIDKFTEEYDIPKELITNIYSNLSIIGIELKDIDNYFIYKTYLILLMEQDSLAFYKEFNDFRGLKKRIFLKEVNNSLTSSSYFLMAKIIKLQDDIIIFNLIKKDEFRSIIFDSKDLKYELNDISRKKREELFNKFNDLYDANEKLQPIYDSLITYLQNRAISVIKNRWESYKLEDVDKYIEVSSLLSLDIKNIELKLNKQRVIHEETAQIMEAYGYEGETSRKMGKHFLLPKLVLKELEKRTNDMFFNKLEEGDVLTLELDSNLDSVDEMFRGHFNHTTLVKHDLKIDKFDRPDAREYVFISASSGDKPDGVGYEQRSKYQYIYYEEPKNYCEIHTDNDEDYEECYNDDIDEDGIINGIDNCPEKLNNNQNDIDQDGIGDVCDGEINEVKWYYTPVYYKLLRSKVKGRSLASIAMEELKRNSCELLGFYTNNEAIIHSCDRMVAINLWPTREDKDRVIDYATSLLGEPYGIPGYYCSKVTWESWINGAGIDLEPHHSFQFDGFVLPDEIVDSDYTVETDSWSYKEQKEILILNKCPYENNLLRSKYAKKINENFDRRLYFTCSDLKDLVKEEAQGTRMETEWLNTEIDLDQYHNTVLPNYIKCKNKSFYSEHYSFCAMTKFLMGERMFLYPWSSQKEMTCYIGNNELDNESIKYDDLAVEYRVECINKLHFQDTCYVLTPYNYPDANYPGFDISHPHFLNETFRAYLDKITSYMANSQTNEEFQKCQTCFDIAKKLYKTCPDFIDY